MKRIVVVLCGLMVLVACEQVAKKYHFVYHQTKKVEQIDNYFGVEVADPYRWLEDDNSEETTKWVQAQNKVTFDYLESIPYRDKINERLSQLWNYPKYSTPFEESGNYYFYKNDGLQNQSVLYVQQTLDAEPEVFLDPNKFSEDGTTALRVLQISRDGKYCAYSIAKGGSDWNEIFVMEVATKKKTDDHLKWVKFSGIGWHGDGFYYTRYPQPETGKELSSQNENAKIYYHKVGTDQSEDILIYQDKKNPQIGFYAYTPDDEKYVFIYARKGATNNNALFFRELTDNLAQGDFKTLIGNFDNDYGVVDHIDGKFLVATNANAPKYKMVLMDPNNPSEENWKEIIPEKEEVLEGVTTAGGKIFTQYMKDVTSRVYVYDMEGNMENEIKLPTLGNAGGFKGEQDDKFVFYTFTSYTYPTTIYKYDIETQTSTLFRKSELDFPSQDYETRQVFYKSKDGTKIPMFITHKKGLELDGENPTVLYGYGGFNINIMPGFRIANLIFLENGGVYAVANLRGGSEYGEKWHLAGALFNKQNVFDDFIAAAQYLIKEKYTNSQKLAISGRSNGGLLVAACMAQHPDLFKVALPAVGVLDMLRYHRFTIGHAWIVEYGCADSTKKEFENLYAYSPLHNLKQDVEYPATLVVTADHDDRVVPAHSFKFIAELQAKHQGDNPVIIRIETMGGHGGGTPTSKRIEEATDLWSFVFDNLGVRPIY